MYEKAIMMSPTELDRILDGVLNGAPLTYKNVVDLLEIEDRTAIEKVMAAARELRTRYFGFVIFLYGFVYFSTYCRNHCSFCYYRKGNTASPRYRKTTEAALSVALDLEESGACLVDLTMGEDPFFYDRENFDVLFRMLEEIKNRTGVAVMVSPGVAPEWVLDEFVRLRADWFALYQETHTPALFESLRLGQSYVERERVRLLAAQKGLLVEDGILLGVGETTHDAAHSLFTMQGNCISQARVMGFVPQPQTPMEHVSRPSPDKELLCISIMRLLMPDRLIPASLDIDGIKGLPDRLRAGANVVTSIIPAGRSLVGVSQHELDISAGQRTIPAVKKVLDQLQLKPASAPEYETWINLRRERQRHTLDYNYADGYCRRPASRAGGPLSSPARRN
jgi:methylornithine synthase